MAMEFRIPCPQPRFLECVSKRGVLRANDGDSAVMADCHIGQKPKV